MVPSRSSDWAYFDAALLLPQGVSCDREGGSPRTGLKAVKVEQVVCATITSCQIIYQSSCCHWSHRSFMDKGPAGKGVLIGHWLWCGSTASLETMPLLRLPMVEIDQETAGSESAKPQVSQEDTFMRRSQETEILSKRSYFESCILYEILASDRTINWRKRCLMLVPRLRVDRSLCHFEGKYLWPAMDPPSSIAPREGLVSHQRAINDYWYRDIQTTALLYKVCLAI